MVNADKKQIALIVSLEEYELIHEKAKNEGRSMGAWVKFRILPYLEDMGEIEPEREA